MAEIAVFDTSKYTMMLANNQVNAKSNSSNQDFYEVLGQAKKDITTKEPKNTVVENPEKNVKQTFDEGKVQITENKDVKEEAKLPEGETKVVEAIKEIEPEKKLDDDVLKEIQETFAEIMMILEQMIGQNENDFAKLMEELNINVEDFLSKDPKELILEITNEESTALITNEELLNTVTEVTGKIEELIEGLETKTELPKEEIIDLLDKIKEPVMEDSENILEPIADDLPIEENTVDTNEPVIQFEKVETKFIPREDLKESSEVEIPVVEIKTIEVAEKTKPVEKNEDTKSVETVLEEPKETVVQETTYKMDDNPKKDSDEPSKEQHQEKGILHQEVKPEFEEVKEPVVEKPEVFEYTDKTTQESILKQIQDNLKIQKLDDATTMEFQLHPQSLGNVKIALTTRGGSITASISAQNETVKQALETQVTALKSNLEEQGVKVEAIEISVESHNLERNLDEHGENQKEQQNKELDEKITKVRRRNINLKAWAEGDEIVSEDELDEDTILTAQMMELYGNSMDLLA